MAIVGNGPSPFGGSQTSTSIGVPSKLGTRSASLRVGQYVTPSRGSHAWPNGAGGAAAAAPGKASAASARRTGGTRIRGTVPAPRLPAVQPPVRIGVVGLGYWGPNLARNFDLLEGSELRWLCDERDEVRE